MLLAMTAEPRVTKAPSAPTPRATIAEWLAVPEERRAELIDGRIVDQGMPGPAHGRAQGNVFGALGPRFDRRKGDEQRPGGWWLSIEVDMELGGMALLSQIGVGGAPKEPAAVRTPGRRAEIAPGLVTAARVSR